MSGKLNMDEDKHREFVDRLIDDDEFRAAYEADPCKVLTEAGIAFDPAEPPKPGKLPDRETLKRMREEIVRAFPHIISLGGYMNMQSCE